MAKSRETLGRDVVVSLIKDNAPLVEVTAIKSFSIKFKVEKITEQYLGRQNPSYDNISDGVDIDIKFNVDDDKYLAVVEALLESASDRQKQIILTAQCAIKFSTGRVRKVLFSPLVYGDIPLDISARNRYMESGLNCSCSQPKFLTS